MPHEPIELEQTEQGVILPVKAKQGASRDALQRWQNGHLHMSTTQIAENEKANQPLRELIAQQLQLGQSEVSLLAVATRANKRLLVTKITAAALAHRIADVLGK